MCAPQGAPLRINHPKRSQPHGLKPYLLSHPFTDSQLQCACTTTQRLAEIPIAGKNPSRTATGVSYGVRIGSNPLGQRDFALAAQLIFFLFFTLFFVFFCFLVQEISKLQKRQIGDDRFFTSITLPPDHRNSLYNSNCTLVGNTLLAVANHQSEGHQNCPVRALQQHRTELQITSSQ